MFGQNEKKAPIKGDGSFLFVKKIFKTIQCEGPNAGTPAIFIRLGGCNLACSFCDTDFDNDIKIQTSEIISKAENLSLNQENKRVINLIVITGGEPMLQGINKICNELINLGFALQIETNGTIYRKLPQKVEIICSPKITKKKYFSLSPDLLPRINAFKFLVSTTIEGYGLIPELGQSEYNIPIFLQPMDEYDSIINQQNKELAVKLALEKGYNISYQIHKDLGIE